MPPRGPHVICSTSFGPRIPDTRVLQAPKHRSGRLMKSSARRRRTALNSCLLTDNHALGLSGHTPPSKRLFRPLARDCLAVPPSFQLSLSPPPERSRRLLQRAGALDVAGPGLPGCWAWALCLASRQLAFRATVRLLTGPVISQFGAGQENGFGDGVVARGELLVQRGGVRGLSVSASGSLPHLQDNRDWRLQCGQDVPDLPLLRRPLPRSHGGYYRGGFPRTSRGD